MIFVRHVSKRYLTRQGWRTVLHDINFTLQKGEKIGILGRNGTDKSILIRLISGVEPSSEGEIKRTMSISWLLAFSGVFQDSLTGMDNLRFIYRIYNIDIDYVESSTEELSELGQYLYEPVRRCSSGMKARLAFALSLAVEFDCYLTDEVIVVGDSRFAKKCKYELFKKCKECSIILISHSHSVMKQYRNNAMVLENDHMHTFEGMDKAYEYYNALTQSFIIRKTKEAV